MRRLGAILLILGAIGCGEETTPETDPEEDPTPANDPPGPLAEDATFQLRATPSGPYHVGQAATFDIQLVPRGEYHVNVDPNFPFGIALGGPAAVQFGEETLDRADAAEFTEQRARFAVAFTPRTAGSHEVTATVDFAVCTPTTCLPEQRTLAVVLPVE